MPATLALQDEFFDAVMESLPRKDMHAFLKLFRPQQQLHKKSAEGACVPHRHSTRRGDGIAGGLVTVWNETYSAHKILFSLFRKSGGGGGDLVLTSRKECRISRSGHPMVKLNCGLTG